MNKKLLMLTLSAIMVITMMAVSGCSKNESEVINEEITLVQGIKSSCAPFTVADADGNVSGFDVELCQALCEELGWNYETAVVDWNNKDGALDNGDCDCLWSAFNMEGKDDNYSFSIPYGTAAQVIVVKKDSGIKTWDDLAGKMVVVQDGSDEYDNLNSGVAADLAKTFGSLVVEPTSEAAWEDFTRGAVDAIAIEDTVAYYLMGENEDAYEIMSENLGWIQYAVAFRKSDGELANKISEGLKQLVKNGKFDEIAAKYPAIKPFMSVSEG